MNRFLVTLLFLLGSFLAEGQGEVKLRKKDKRRDVLLQTTYGNILVRLSDSTPLHRDNFLRLVKSRFYDSLLFHRVIPGFMIQAGDPGSRRAAAGQPLGSGSPGYTVPAEFRPSLFHRKGVLAAARTGDNINPERRSSSSQFYIVQGRTFTDRQLDSVEVARLQGRKIPAAHREVYKTVGGTPQLDGNYTVFGTVISGLEVVDRIAGEQTSRNPPDRPLKDIAVIKARLVKRKRS